MPFTFGASSERQLVGVKAPIVRWARLVLERSPLDFSIPNGGGKRSKGYQASLVAGGSSRNPLSPHLDGDALDLWPYLGPGVDCFPRKGDSPEKVRALLANFETLARVGFEVADEIELPLQWGNDWDIDGIPTGRDPDEKGYLQDLVHFQTPPPHRLKQALERRLWRIAARARGEAVIS